MNCPNCGHDLPEGAGRCPACDAKLNRTEDEAPAHLPEALVTVLESRDPSLIPVVRSLLEAEGIPCTVENEVLQDLIGLGRMATGYDVSVGPAYVQVAAADEEAARALIAHHLKSRENDPEN